MSGQTASSSQTGRRQRAHPIARAGSLGLRGSAIVCWLLAASTAHATEWFVAPHGEGTGTSADPFGRVQDGLQSAQPGDVVIVRSGVYDGQVHSVRPGTAEAPIVLRAEESRGATIRASGNGLLIAHPFITIEGLVFDGGYGDGDGVRIGDDAHGLVLRNVEVRRSGRDCVDMGAPEGVLIEGSLIHHCLNATDGRTDAHGIVAGAVRDLTIRDTEIHTFSGDAVQLDPRRAAPGWDRVTIERCRFWLAPLPEAENGFAAGIVPGENGIDTKTWPNGGRAGLIVRDSEMWGFRGGLITNMAALNLKEKIQAVIDGVTVRESDIAFRIRGATDTRPAGAWVGVQNAVVYDVRVAMRYEDAPENLRFLNSTIGVRVARPFQGAPASKDGFTVRNVLFLGSRLPAEAAGGSNLAVTEASFVDAEAGNYRLRSTSRAVDAGQALVEVPVDRDRIGRPQSNRFDVGAYEFCPGDCFQPPTPPTAVIRE